MPAEPAPPAALLAPPAEPPPPELAPAAALLAPPVPVSLGECGSWLRPPQATDNANSEQAAAARRWVVLRAQGLVEDLGGGLIVGAGSA